MNIISSNNFWGDDDGDGQGIGGISITGNLKISIKDVNNNVVNLTDNLEPCNAPYKFTLTADAGSLSTKYGNPNTLNFTGGSHDFYLTTKVTMPYACYARPNLKYNYGTDLAWNGNKGFLKQDINTLSSNFPRTGFDGAFF